MIVNSFYELSAYYGPGILYSFLYRHELFKFPQWLYKIGTIAIPIFFFLTYEQIEA